MRYSKVVQGTFVSRPNRFVAFCDIDGVRERCHVKNTGRCREILVPSARVILSESDNADRKTRYDLIAVYKGDNLINIDSQAPNAAFYEFLQNTEMFGPEPMIFPEHVHGDSRFDFYIESGDKRAFIEVKGVTLENDGLCRFPDAPTERGLKHVRGLEKCVEEGYGAYVAFVIQMKGMRMFEPNRDTDPAFSEELERAYGKGVGILVYDCVVSEDSMKVDSPLPFGFGHS